MPRSDPKQRKAQIMEAALTLARRNGFESVRMEGIANEAGCVNGLVVHYWGTMSQLRRAIMREAVRIEDLQLVAQGLAVGHPAARKAPQALKEQAAAYLVGV